MTASKAAAASSYFPRDDEDLSVFMARRDATILNMSARRKRRVALWAWGLAAWIVIAWVVEKVIPEQSGPFEERPVGIALLVGAVFGLSAMIVDLIRAPHRRWLWGLTAWGVLLSLNVLVGINDSDLDQWIGWGVLLGGVVGLPVIVADVRAAAKSLDRG